MSSTAWTNSSVVPAPDGRAHRPRRRFGQNFLHDPAIIRRIVDAVDPRPDEWLVEIGPGLGALTGLLLERAGSLDVVEIDRDLAARLRDNHAAKPSLRVHVDDALRFDFGALAATHQGRLRVVGNLPYNISTPLLFHLVEQRAALVDLHVMLQDEVVERIVAQPGTADYGRLTVMLRLWCEAQRLFRVGPGAFRPTPKVSSALLRLRVRETPAVAVPAGEAFARVVACAFSQRRKTLRNSLRPLLATADIAQAGVDPGARAETLDLPAFAALARRLSGATPAPTD